MTTICTDNTPPGLAAGDVTSLPPGSSQALASEKVHIELTDASALPYVTPEGTSTVSIMVVSGTADIDGITYSAPDGINLEQGPVLYPSFTVDNISVGGVVRVLYTVP